MGFIIKCDSKTFADNLLVENKFLFHGKNRFQKYNNETEAVYHAQLNHEKKKVNKKHEYWYFLPMSFLFH